MWGSNDFKQCAQQTSQSLRVPTLIPELGNIKNRIKYTLGGFHSLLLANDGLYGWVSNTDKNLTERDTTIREDAAFRKTCT